MTDLNPICAECHKPADLQVKYMSVLVYWICASCYNTKTGAGVKLQILDDIESLRERIIQDKMMGGK